MGNRIGPYLLHFFLPNIKYKKASCCQFSTRKGYVTFYLNKLQTKTKTEEENETNQKYVRN